MTSTADKSDPALWEKVKKKVTREAKGGKPGQWSARKAQLAVHDYKEEGGGYEGKKSEDNSLSQWTHEEWGTKSGKESLETGERYLPKKARETLSPEEYKRTSAKKKADLKKGKQFSAQPADVAKKAASARETGRQAGETLAALRERARAANIPGRSRMKKEDLQAALRHQGKS